MHVVIPKPPCTFGRHAFAFHMAISGRNVQFRPNIPILWSVVPIGGDYCVPRTCFAGNDLLHAASRSVPAPTTCGRGGIGRRAALRSLWGNPWKFESSRPHQNFPDRLLLASRVGKRRHVVVTRLPEDRNGSGSASFRPAAASFFQLPRKPGVIVAIRRPLHPGQNIGHDFPEGGWRRYDDIFQDFDLFLRRLVGRSAKAGPIPSSQGRPRCN